MGRHPPWALEFLDPTTNIHQNHELLAKGVLPCIHYVHGKIQLFVSKLLPTGACIPVHKWFITRIFPVEHCRTAAWLFPLKFAMVIIIPNDGWTMKKDEKKNPNDQTVEGPLVIPGMHPWLHQTTPITKSVPEKHGHRTHDCLASAWAGSPHDCQDICLGKLFWRKRFVGKMLIK